MARVLVVGIGGLGCPAAIALARAGIEIGIADDDEVDVTNLHRQILFRDEDVGRPKVVVAAARLRAMGARVTEHATRLLPRNAVELVAAYDLVVEGSDNFPTKFLAADACRIAERPIVHAAAVRWHGTALAVGRRGQPCYRCLFEDLPRDNPPNCAEAGVIGPMVGVVGAVQADLALRLLEGDDVAGTLFTFDARTRVHRRRTIQKRAGCILCDTGGIREVDASRYTMTACAAEDA